MSPGFVTSNSTHVFYFFYLIIIISGPFAITALCVTLDSITFTSLLSFFLWRCDPKRVMASSFLRFLDHTQQRTTVVRTPLDELSARRIDFYPTTNNTHNRQLSMPPVGFEPKISAGERPQAAHLLRSWVQIPPGLGYLSVVSVVCCQVEVSATS